MYWINLLCFLCVICYFMSFFCLLFSDSTILHHLLDSNCEGSRLNFLRDNDSSLLFGKYPQKNKRHPDSWLQLDVSNVRTLMTKNCAFNPGRIEHRFVCPFPFLTKHLGLIQHKQTNQTNRCLLYEMQNQNFILHLGLSTFKSCKLHSVHWITKMLVRMCPVFLTCSSMKWKERNETKQNHSLLRDRNQLHVGCTISIMKGLKPRVNVLWCGVRSRTRFGRPAKSWRAQENLRYFLLDS